MVGIDGLRAEVRKHRGRVLLVDFWAMWCEPCKESMPALVALQETYASRGLTVLAVNRDEPEQWTTEVMPFLRSVKVGFPNVVLANVASADAVAWLGTRWRSELPARFLISRGGVVAEEMLADVSDAELEKRVRRELKRK